MCFVLVVLHFFVYWCILKIKICVSLFFFLFLDETETSELCSHGNRKTISIKVNYLPEKTNFDPTIIYLYCLGSRAYGFTEDHFFQFCYVLVFLLKNCDT